VWRSALLPCAGQKISTAYFDRVVDSLAKTRPTAINLFWAPAHARGFAAERGRPARTRLKQRAALQIFKDDIAANKLIGRLARRF
jgi:methylthioribose-1-phosphate isomerase